MDEALLWARSMDLHDLHIHVLYCTFAAFKALALNYLMLDSH